MYRSFLATLGAALIAHAALAPLHRASAQSADKVQNEKTTSPPEGRYEIIQSSLGVRITLRLNRFNGNTTQLVSRPDSLLVWQQVVRLPHSESDVVVSSKPNYVIFTSGIAAQFTFLMNVNTGSTWQLREDPRQGMFWTPVY